MAVILNSPAIIKKEVMVEKKVEPKYIYRGAGSSTAHLSRPLPPYPQYVNVGMTCVHTGPGSGNAVVDECWATITQKGSDRDIRQYTFWYTTNPVDVTNYSYMLVNAVMDRNDAAHIYASRSTDIINSFASHQFGLHLNKGSNGLGGVIGINISDLQGAHYLGFYYSWTSNPMTCKARIYSMLLI